MKIYNFFVNIRKQPSEHTAWFMVIATNHMAMEAFWNYTLIH
jgi:hypothetical protein